MMVTSGIGLANAGDNKSEGVKNELVTGSV